MYIHICIYIYGFRSFTSARARLSPRIILTTNQAGLPVAPGFYFEREKEKERAKERKRGGARERNRKIQRKRKRGREREGGREK